MSWHYLQGQEVASWGGDCLDGAPSALLRLIPMRAESCLPDRQTDALTDSRSGTMCGPLMERDGGERSTSSAVVFPAKTSASQEEARASMVQSLDSGWKWPASFAKWDPALCLWKTRQRSLVEGLDVFSETWPRWGMMRDGQCWELITSELPIKDIACGLWPTRVADGDRATNYAQGGTSLGYAVRNWPTPTVHGNHNRKGASKNSGDGLATAVKMWVIPTCHDKIGRAHV